MTIRKICILGLEDYAMLTGDSSFGHVGGESVQHVLLARAWRDLGLETTIIVYDHGQPRVTTIDGVRAVAAFRPDEGVRALRFVHPRLTHVTRAMREVDADVYYQSPAAAWSGVMTWFARRHGKRSIVRIASDIDCQRGKQAIRHRRDRWLFDYGVLHSSLLAAQTAHQRQLLNEHYGVRSEIVNVAVDPPSASATPHKDIDVVWVGNFREMKRPDLALELARRLPQYRFAVIGGSVRGMDAYFEEIARAAHELPNVHLTGPVPYRDIDAWFDRSRIHLNTSDVEGFPNTFLQAWIRCVPVVSFFDPDGLIRQRGLGRSCRDMDEIAAALEQLLHNPVERADIGRRAHAFATREFSARQVAARYLDLLKSELNAPVPAQAQA